MYVFIFLLSLLSSSLSLSSEYSQSFHLSILSDLNEEELEERWIDSGPFILFHSHTTLTTHNQGNLALFGNITTPTTFHLPIPVNLLLIGFEGEGNEGLHLSNEEFHSWFQFIDTEFHHTVVPVGEEQTTTEHFPTRPTHIEYRYNIHVVRTSPLVTTILEDAIIWHLRPEDPE